MFNEKERLLANEAALTSSMLSSGLHALRKANIFQMGLYYQAFFSLSIGVERLLKIIIITQYRCENEGLFPTDLQIKNYGHDLLDLFKAASTDNFEKEIHKEILDFLNKFAKSSRYYNIDVMVNQKTRHNDPLKEWKGIQDKILKECGKRKVMKNKEELAQLVDKVSLIRFHDLQGSDIDSSIGVLEEMENIDLIQGYAIQYIFEIVKYLVNMIKKLERKKYLMPVLSEFFSFYNDYWTSYQIRKKKNWLNIVG